MTIHINRETVDAMITSLLSDAPASRTEAANMIRGICSERDTLLDENEQLREALISARVTILQLYNAPWSESEGEEDDWVGFIDAALEPRA